MKTAIFLFRRDLRLSDNKSLIKAISKSYKVLPIFIFSPEQIDRNLNRYFSNPAVQFMTESLRSLNSELKTLSSHLNFFFGDLGQVLKFIHSNLKFDALFTNKDYTKYAKKRSSREESICQDLNVDYFSYEDYNLTKLNEGLKKDGTPYYMYSPYYRNWLEIKKDLPNNFIFKNDHFLSFDFTKANKPNGLYFGDNKENIASLLNHYFMKKNDPSKFTKELLVIKDNYSKGMSFKELEKKIEGNLENIEVDYLRDFDFNRKNILQKVMKNIENFPTNLNISEKELSHFYEHSDDYVIHGGRTKGLKALERIEKLKDYGTNRNFPAKSKTTRLSAHLKFGTVSMREFYSEVLEKNAQYGDALIREVAFREFYVRVFYHEKKRKLEEGESFLGYGNFIKWEDYSNGKEGAENKKVKLEKDLPLISEDYEAVKKYVLSLYSEEKLSKEEITETLPRIQRLNPVQRFYLGLTFFPIVDAGMRQLLVSGFMHNRVRMITANFFAKYLLVDWKIGAEIFSKSLVDCDVVSNYAGWGWSSSTGPDAPPFFRPPFNPWTQSKKFDGEGKYIKEWVKELDVIGMEGKDLYKWGEDKVRDKYSRIVGEKYGNPIVDSKEASRRAVDNYRNAWEESK